MRALQVALAIGIAALLPLLAEMTVRIFKDPPTWQSNGYAAYYSPKDKGEAEQMATEDRKRQQEYESRQADYNVLSFYVTFPLGILELLAGFALRRRSTLAAGVLFGGLASITCGAFQAWDTLPGVTRYLCLLLTLALLVAIAVLVDREWKPLGSNTSGP